MNVEQKDNLENLKSKVRKLEKILKESKYKKILFYMDKYDQIISGVRISIHFRDKFIFQIKTAEFTDINISLEEVDDLIMFKVLLYSIGYFLSALDNNMRSDYLSNPSYEDLVEILDSLCVKISNLETFK